MKTINCITRNSINNIYQNWVHLLFPLGIETGLYTIGLFVLVTLNRNVDILDPQGND